MIKIKTTLENALKTVEALTFDPVEDIQLENTYLVLSSWKIIFMDLILKEGFIIQEEYSPLQYSKNLSVIIQKDECIYSNESYYTLLEDLLGINRKSLKNRECELIIRSNINDKN